MARLGSRALRGLARLRRVLKDGGRPRASARTDAERGLLALDWLLLTVCVAGFAPCQATAQVDSVAVTAQPRYGRGGIYRALFGPHYRDLWTTPVQVEVLNMRPVSGTLTPTTSGGRRQTRSLRFIAPDGRQFSFRSVDKAPTGVLPPDLEGTVAERILQDQTSAQHPAAPVVVSPLMRAVGVLAGDVRLVVLPDDSLLGQFRGEFAGMLGTFEQRPLERSGTRPGFLGATNIIDSDSMIRLVWRSPDERVDARAFLKARLMDVWIGDWDRHRGQWRWVRLPERGDAWLPLPEDRDQAFSKYDGLFPGVARQYYAELLNFTADYPGVYGLHSVARELDRWVLAGLDRATWDSTARGLVALLTDSLIDAAVAREPRPYFTRNGDDLSAALKRRRDRLPEIAGQLYQLLADNAEVHATNAAELAEVVRVDDRFVEVSLGRKGNAAEPFFQRRYDSRETGEIRVYLYGGDDSVVVRGSGRGGPRIRVIGGQGNDAVVDSVRAGISVYDAEGSNRGVSATGGGIAIDRRPYAQPAPGDSTLPTRDFGAKWMGLPVVSFAPEIGLFAAIGAARESFGFRYKPYATRISFRAGWAFGASTFRADVRGDFRVPNSRVRFDLFARASGIEILRFHGIGNETVLSQPSPFYRVRQEQYRFEPSLVVDVTRALSLSIGPAGQFSDTDLDTTRFIGVTAPYGTGWFGQFGGQAAIRLDTRDRPGSATRGVFVSVGGRVFPAALDVLSAFGSVAGEARTYLSPPIPLKPTLALRAGGRKVWGTFPFHEAAFLGGADNVRGFAPQRFAGNAAVFGSAELRLFLFRHGIVLPGEFGIHGLGDVGRVYVTGETSTAWHSSFGGGIWLGYLNRAAVLSVSVARSDEKTGVYVGGGFGY